MEEVNRIGGEAERNQLKRRTELIGKPSLVVYHRKQRVCQNVHILFLCTKPRLSQARALLFPKVFVPLGIKKISLWQRYTFVLTYTRK